MESNISVSIPTALFLKVVEFLRKHRDVRDPVSAIENAIEYWMVSIDGKPELIVEADSQGYQWKNLFLPSGSQIRMQYKGEYFYAQVEGDSIIYNEKSVTPSTLANTIAGGSRNAWRDLWIKRPAPYEDKEWALADNLRGSEDERTRTVYAALLDAVDKKGEDAVIKIIESTFRKDFEEAGMDMKEGFGKEHLEWIKANYGKAKP